jgi:hypothetical protein
MKIQLVACVATFALAAAALAAPNSGSSGPKGQSQKPSKASSSNSPKFQKNFSKNVANKSPNSAKKANPAFKLTKFKSPSNVPNYNLKYGKSFAFGTYYQGKNHHQWTSYGWSSRFGCYLYWDPSTSAYYYWNDANQAFYPTRYADTVPPTPDMPLIDSDDSADTTAATGPAPAPTPTSMRTALPEPPLE